ncbi:MAG: hypothetical protein KDB27_21140 [Planctomycetales bacterium]|nr:hypothetical protein [Planctomycetales bacterium]
MSDSNTQNNKKPVFRKRLPGGISAAVFENSHDGRTYRSINVQRSYRKNGKWHTMGMYLDHENIPFMIEVLQGTLRYLNEFPVGSHNDQVEQLDPAEDSVSTDVESAAA